MQENIKQSKITTNKKKKMKNIYKKKANLQTSGEIR